MNTKLKVSQNKEKARKTMKKKNKKFLFKQKLKINN